MWCVGKLDEEYIFKMEDVLKVYERPLSEREPVVCVDEKPVVLHEDTRPPIPMNACGSIVVKRHSIPATRISHQYPYLA